MLSVSDKDFGTPESSSSKLVTLEIDGFPVTLPEGTSVLRAAATIDIAIPKLGATEMLDAFGSCRLCLVEIEGKSGYPASCTTAVTDGMKVRTRKQRCGLTWST